jgi:hypothetical protein
MGANLMRVGKANILFFLRLRWGSECSVDACINHQHTDDAQSLDVCTTIRLTWFSAKASVAALRG